MNKLDHFSDLILMYKIIYVDLLLGISDRMKTHLNCP